MSRIREALRSIAEKLGFNTGRLAYARRKHRTMRKRAKGNHDQAVHAAKAADKARANGHPRRARRKDRRAARAHARAHKYQGKAQYWVGRVKEFVAKVHHLEQAQAEKEAELEKWKKDHKLKIRGNKITGGTRKARFRAGCLRSAANCSSGKRRNFYSQPGTWSVDRCLTGEPYGYRSDCSQWVTSVCHSAGLPDPNGTDFGWGFTGTLVGEHGGWKQCSVSEMKKAGFGFVVYGSGTGHHVEAYVGPGEKTIGHGSAPIDAGVIDLFGDGNYRCYSLK